MARLPNHYIFDSEYWRAAVTNDNWYLEFNEFFKQAGRDLGEDSDQYNQLKKQVRHFFSSALKKGIVKLASDGPDLDAARKPIDTIVIHHTSAPPGYDLIYMNAVQLLNVYTPYFAKPTVYEERGLKGKPIWSGHSIDGKPVFWLYHWLVRMDGNCERLLADKYIGWHAGNWEVNRCSVAICLDNDYEKACPFGDILHKLASHIKQNYPDVNKVIGHCEANASTVCPGAHFLTEWKPKLLQLISSPFPDRGRGRV